jgi:formate-dependent nitrite reductase cytochrome c552 subunit|tara:strand:- start:756 stop:941 length:186 start_codon:yes stop_codon:yes gene_type:complete
MQKQFYKIEIIVETDGKKEINLKDIQQLEKDSKVYSIDVTPIDIEEDQFRWVNAIKSLNEL